MLDRAVISRRAAGDEQILPGKETSRAARTAGGLSAGKDVPIHQLCPGSGSWINNTREPPGQKAMLLFPPANNCPRHARAAPAERRLRARVCAFMSSFISVALVP